MICAVSVKVLNVGPMGFCFGPGTRFRGVRALMTRRPTRQFGVNLLIISLTVRTWGS